MSCLAIEASTRHNPLLSGRAVSPGPRPVAQSHTINEQRATVRGEFARVIRAVNRYVSTEYEPGSAAGRWAINETRLDKHGFEDFDKNGRVDTGELDPNDPTDDNRGDVCDKDTDCGDALSGRICVDHKCQPGCRGTGGGTMARGSCSMPGSGATRGRIRSGMGKTPSRSTRRRGTLSFGPLSIHTLPRRTGQSGRVQATRSRRRTRRRPHRQGRGASARCRRRRGGQGRAGGRRRGDAGGVRRPEGRVAGDQVG